MAATDIDQALAGGVTQEALRKRYHRLCGVRDGINFQTALLQRQLDEANARAQQALDEANALAAQIQEIRGGQKWIALKKEIGILATALSGRRR